MMMQHCRQSWEETESIIGFGLPPNAAIETPHRNTGLNQQTGTGPGASFTLPTNTLAARKLNMEPLKHESYSAEDWDPEPHGTEAKRGEHHNLRNQTPAQDRKKGGANVKQNILTTVTATQPGTTKQGVSSRGKSTKSADLPTTNLLLQTEVHKGTTRPTQSIPQPQLSEGPTRRPDDTLTHETTWPPSVKEAKEPTTPTKGTPNSQTVTDLKPTPDQTECSAVTGIEPPPTHRANLERDQELQSGSTSQGQEGPCLGLQPDIRDTVDSILPAPSEPGRRRKGQPATKDSTQDRAMYTLPTAKAKTAPPDAPMQVPTATKEDGPAPTLTPAQMHSIAKRRRQQARVKLPKSSTACFYLTTPVLIWGADGAFWIPIYKTEKGDIVIQSLPSGNIEDLSGALMAKIETACTFGCSKDRIDIVQMGKALITAHHHIQTAEGWMTARQATQHGPGQQINNFHVKRVYNLLLEGGGNIIINTTSNPQEAPSLIVAATMGYRIEQTKDSQLSGSLTYPQASLQRLGQHKGMSTGRRHFQVREALIQPTGEIILEPPIPGDNRVETPARTPLRDRTNPQSRTLDPKTVVQPEPTAVSER